MAMLRRALGLGEKPKAPPPIQTPAATGNSDLTRLAVDNQMAAMAVREALIDSVLDFHLRRPDREPKH